METLDPDALMQALHQLPAEQLDGLIAGLSNLRMLKEPPVADDMPEETLIQPSTRYTVSTGPTGDVVLCFRHGGLGWVGFALPAVHAANLAREIMRTEGSAPTSFTTQ